MGNFPRAKDIPQLQVEQGSTYYAPFRFYFDSSSKLRGWVHWCTSILNNKVYNKRLRDAGVLHCLELCQEFQVYKDDDALDLLVSRWNPKTCTFVTAWREFTPTLEDV